MYDFSWANKFLFLNFNKLYACELCLDFVLSFLIWYIYAVDALQVFFISTIEERPPSWASPVYASWCQSTCCLYNSVLVFNWFSTFCHYWVSEVLFLIIFRTLLQYQQFNVCMLAWDWNIHQGNFVFVCCTE